MPTGDPDRLRFLIRWHESKARRDRGCQNWYTYYAAIGLDLFLGEKRLRITTTLPLPFRLDTEAFISAIPAGWLKDKRFDRFKKTLSAPIPFETATGSG